MTNIIKKTTYEIDKPFQMIEMANVLKAHIVKNNLYAQIVGKNYVLVEGWQFAGGMMGLFPKVVKVENIGNMKWMAQVEIVDKSNRVISSGYAICSKEEMKKKTFDEYAILSMAQTRAIGKAYRNLIGWVIKLAGYEATPAEEMKGETKGKENNGLDEGKSKAGELMASEADKERIIKLADELGMKKLTGLDELTKVEASKILFKLMEKKAKK